jgi:para-nitrobenzyl esterase
MPVARIFEGLKQIRKNPLTGPGDVTPLFMPNVDEELLADQPSEILLSGRGHWCDVMIGTTREEYAAFSYTNPALDELSDAQLKDLFSAQLGNDADIVLARYRSRRVPATPKTLLGDLNTDGFFTTKSLEIAAAQSRHNGRAFTYFFDWQSTNPSMGACHCIDLPFLFGNIDLWMAAAPMLKGSDWQEVTELSRIYRGAVTAFATSGDPNSPGLPEWPAYGRRGTALHFDRRIRALSHFV